MQDPMTEEGLALSELLKKALLPSRVFWLA
jgi:hypothetical protein